MSKRWRAAISRPIRRPPTRRLQESGQTFTRQIDRLPPAEVVKEIDDKVDIAKLEKVLIEEGIAKFAEPQKKLLATVAEKRPVGTAR